METSHTPVPVPLVFIFPRLIHERATAAEMTDGCGGAGRWETFRSRNFGRTWMLELTYTLWESQLQQ